MHDIALFFLLPPFADWEGAYLASYLTWQEADKPFDVKTVSLSRDPIKSIGGFTILPDYALEDIPSDYGALILIGGDSWRTPDAQYVVDLVKSTRERGILIAAICDSVTFLAKEGFLNEHKHTGNNLEDIRAYAGEAYTNTQNFLNEPAVVDGNLITAPGTAPLEFAKLVLETLQVEKPVNIATWYNENKGCKIEADK